jgi:hypothetical protein
MKTFLNYVTGCTAVMAIITAVLVMMNYIATNNEAASKLAGAMLGGIGSVLGAAIGGMLIFRFKAARRFIRNLFSEGDND